MSGKRLAVFMPSLAGGGAQRSSLTLAGGLALHGHQVDLVLANADGPYLADVPPAVRLVDLEAGRVAASVLPLRRYLRRARPDAVLSVMSHANVAAVWARQLSGVSTRLILSERIAPATVGQFATRRRERVMPWLMRRFYPWADGVVAVSAGVADQLAAVSGLPRERIEVIYNPVMRPALLERAESPLEHPWFRPGEPPVILSVGTLTARKDLATLIRAFEVLRRTRQARLLILGEGRERTALERLIDELELRQDVSLPGFVDNPYAYMARASLFVLSSRSEGLPGALIEALCCGTPVVATDCPSGPREILNDGQYGRLVPVGDAAALAVAMEQALDNPSPAPAESWQRFELDRAVRHYLETLLPESTPSEGSGEPASAVCGTTR